MASTVYETDNCDGVPQNHINAYDNCKIPSCTYYLKEVEIKIIMLAHFKDCHGNHK